MQNVLDVLYEIIKLIKKFPHRGITPQWLRQQIHKQTPGFESLSIQVTVQAQDLHSIIANYNMFQKVLAGVIGYCEEGRDEKLDLGCSS